jgi:hypothetical protein
MFRWLLSAVLLMLLATSGRAALDPESNKLYQVRIVLGIVDHREYTAFFKERLQRGLQDSLQAALGPMGNVEVATRPSVQAELKEKALTRDRQAVLERTLQQILHMEKTRTLPGLEEGRELAPVKTHFILIDLDQGEHEIQTRQLDGLTGLASPVARRVRTRDREMVGRIAVLLVDRDFGLVGTLEPVGSGISEVQVAFKGGGLAPLTPWVKPGEVFAVAQIKEGRGGVRSFRVTDTLLQLVEEPKDGVGRCRLLHRRKDPLAAGPAVLGYRCFKLGTTQAKLQLRLVDDKDRPLGVQHIVVTGSGFGPNPKSDLATDADGFTRELGPYEHVAFLQVLKKQSGLPLSGKIPLAILDDRPQVCHVQLDDESDPSGQLEFERKALIGRLDEGLLGVSALVLEVNKLSSNAGTREDALAKARAGLKDLEEDLANYLDGLRGLRRAEIRLKIKLNLTPVEQRYQALEHKKKEFQDYVTHLDGVIRDEKDPLRAELLEMANRARSLENEAEFDKAIQLYEALLRKGSNLSGYQMYAEHLDQLKKDWEPKSEPHRQARDFIYMKWRNLETAAEIKAALDEAKQALATFKSAGDRLTPLMLLKANTLHFTRLAKRLESVLGSMNPEDQAEGKSILEVKDGLEKLTNETRDFLRPTKPAG